MPDSITVRQYYGVRDKHWYVPPEEEKIRESCLGSAKELGHRFNREEFCIFCRKTVVEILAIEEECGDA